MTTEEIIATLRRKQESHGYIGWRLCQEMADALEEQLLEQQAEEEKKRYQRCPFCGGRLSEIRGSIRHCFSCHFEFQVPEEVLNEIYKY